MFAINIFQLLFLLGGIQGLFLSSILLRKDFINLKFLGFFVFAISLASLKIPIQELYPTYFEYFPIPLLYQFSLGPLLYLFTLSSLKKNIFLEKKHLLFFIPSILFDGILIVVLRNFNTQFLEEIFFIMDILAFLYMSFFVMKSIKLQIKYKKELQNYFSNKQKETSLWLKRVIVVSVIILVLWFLYLILTLTFLEYRFLGIKTYYPIYFFISLSVYYLGYVQSHQKELIKIDRNDVRISKSKNSHDLGKIKSEILENKFHIDENLTIKSLALSLKLPINELSQTINQIGGKNFNDFINELRVEEVKEKIKNNDFGNYNLLGLGLSSGFSSKASFYRAFKKFTGKTPSQYFKDVSNW